MHFTGVLMLQCGEGESAPLPGESLVTATVTRFPELLMLPKPQSCCLSHSAGRFSSSVNVGVSLQHCSHGALSHQQRRRVLGTRTSKAGSLTSGAAAHKWCRKLQQVTRKAARSRIFASWKLLPHFPKQHLL